jgi:hypothetical protein
MKFLKSFVFVVTVVVSMMLLQLTYAAEPTFDFGGYVRVDLTGESTSNGSDVVSFSPGDRALLNFTGRIENESGFYAEAYGEGKFSVNGSASAGDVYLETGNSSFNFRAGNAGVDDAFIWGEDFYVAEVDGVTLYSADDFDNGDLQEFLNFTLSDMLKLQVGGYIQSGDVDDVATTNFGIRPVVTVTTGNLTFGVGTEYLLSTPQDGDLEGESTTLGFGGYASAELGTITVGGGAAMGTFDGESFEDGSDIDEETALQARGFATFSVGEVTTIGVAGGYAMEDESEDESVFGYVAYYIKPFMIDGLRLQLGASFASGTVADEDATVVGGKARLRYDF